MSAKVVRHPFGQDMVNILSRQSEPVGDVVHRRDTGSFAMGVHLDGDRHGMPIRGVHLDAKQHAMGDLSRSLAR